MQIEHLTPPADMLHSPRIPDLVLRARPEDGGAISIICALWWTRVPALAGERIGIIGYFCAGETSADSAAAFLADTGSAAALLTAAADELATRGCTLAVGPMDGNTWENYRAVTERGAEPPFFMEPDTPAAWPEIFAAADFEPIAHYTSTLIDDLAHSDPRVPAARERFLCDGVEFRSIRMESFEDELRRIYAVSRVSFAANFLYTEISEDEFIRQYTPYRDKIRPEIVILAERADAPVGFVFGIPDYAEAMRGEPIRTLVAKTMAVLPERRLAGLGVVLADILHRNARSLGLTRAIHALQHESNLVRNMTSVMGKVMRRYALFGKRLV